MYITAPLILGKMRLFVHQKASGIFLAGYLTTILGRVSGVHLNWLVFTDTHFFVFEKGKKVAVESSQSSQKSELE